MCILYLRREENLNGFLILGASSLIRSSLIVLRIFFGKHTPISTLFKWGGLETASIAIITAIVMKGHQRGTPVAGFYIRKSRKIIGLQKIIEGEVNDHPVILVDDLINSGNTFLKQLEVLKREHKKVIDIFTLVRFRDLAEYTFARKENIVITAPFTLADFGIKSATQAQLPRHDIFNFEWMHQSPRPNYFYRVPKSSPILDGDKVYFGSDDGVMRALDQATGKEQWKFRIYGLGSQGKTIFSSPALHDGMLYFGAYDGNFYALDAQSGKKKWIYMDADWIGASPTVAPDLGLVYIGLEYGLWKKHGGIVALNHRTGEKAWEYIDMPSLTHGSPAYSKKFNAVAIGSNNGVLYFFRATDGKLLWQFQTQGDIKYIPTFDETRGYILFGSLDMNMYILDVTDGKLIYTHHAETGIYSQPLVWNDRAYVVSTDKRIYCINLKTLTPEWNFLANGRLFASPVIAEDKLYVGSNDGRLYEIDPLTGKNSGFFQTTERIMNKIAYNPETKRFFVLTYANELYCLTRR
jgi:outer membrane protein assembly factor BamB